MWRMFKQLGERIAFGVLPALAILGDRVEESVGREVCQGDRDPTSVTPRSEVAGHPPERETRKEVGNIQPDYYILADVDACAGKCVALDPEAVRGLMNRQLSHEFGKQALLGPFQQRQRNHQQASPARLLGYRLERVVCVRVLGKCRPRSEPHELVAVDLENLCQLVQMFDLRQPEASDGRGIKPDIRVAGTAADVANCADAAGFSRHRVAATAKRQVLYRPDVFLAASQPETQVPATQPAITV